MKIQKTIQKGCIILAATMLLILAGCSGGGQSQEDRHTFDFYIDLTTREDIEILSGKSFVKGVFSFTVAGIFRQKSLFAQFEAVSLLNDQLIQVFSDQVDEFDYTNAYVKAADPAALKNYFDDEFIAHLPLRGLSDEEIASMPREDLNVPYEEYEDHMKRLD